jgi:hypothetical protein
MEESTLRIQQGFMPAVCLLFLSAMGTQAQNLVPNPGFDHDISGWTAPQGSVLWSNLDAGGSAFSGSLSAEPLAGGASSASVRSGCFPASPGAYSFQYKYYMPGTQPSGMGVFLRWYSDASCSQLIDNSSSLGGGHNTAWESLSTSSFGLNIVAPPQTQSSAVQLISTLGKTYFDDVSVQRQTSCPSGHCLHNNRFDVTVRWTVRNQSGNGQQVSLTSDSELFWFFNADNIEMVVKVLDGCGVNGHYWVFMGGLTNVGVEATVTDVATGVARTYNNTEGIAFQPIQDTLAFATCP